MSYPYGVHYGRWSRYFSALHCVCQTGSVRILSYAAPTRKQGGMNTTFDTQMMQLGSPSWPVRFVTGQAGPWGRPPGSQWKWTGRGLLAANQGYLTLVGRRHRFFWASAKQVVRVELKDVHNVTATGSLLRFEVALEGKRKEVVSLRAGDLQAAADIAAALPTTRTPEFDQAQEDKRTFDRSLEQLGTRAIVTPGLVAANVAMFLLIATQSGGWLVPNPRVIFHWGSNFGPATVNGQWWRLLTCMFIHFGLIHLTLNMWVLWSIGRLIERMFGSLNYFVLYLFAGLIGSLTSIWWHPDVNSAGASGAIFGLLGGLLAFLLNPATRIPPTIAASQRRSTFVFIAYNLFTGFTHQGIDNAAHLGGLLSGFVMGWMLAMPLEPEAREHAASRCALAAAFGMAVLMALAWPLARAPHLSSAYVFPDNTSRHSIVFYPWQYEPVAFNSGARVSIAMRAVYDAPDAAALNAAIAVVSKMAESGDPEAAFRLGRYYHLESAEPDYALALKYYQIAANENHAWATNNLGLLYRDGTGVPRSDQKAYYYFVRASRQNDSWAYLNLADMTFQGRGVPADRNQGLAWLEDGGAKNCTACYIQEAAIYHSGAYGIQPDRNRTVWLLNKAAALGDEEAKLILAELYIVGDGVPQSSSTSLKILKTLSDDGNGNASDLLGELSSDDKIRDYLFETSLGGIRQMPADYTSAFPQDSALAIRYWERADQQGNCQSLIDLSSLFDRGVGVSIDYRKAAGYVERAVRCDPTNSFYLWKLGKRFYDARGVSRDCVTAGKVFAESLDHGYADAGVDLGYIYDKGCAPIAEDDYRAFQIYLLCAKLGVALCQNNVGAMLKHGRGVTTADIARGYGWIKLAALHGDELAKANLGDPLFTTKVRAAGLLDLADIQHRLLTVPADPRAIARDPWY